MSKKITSKMLKDLITEVMSEERQLNEFKVDLGNDPSKEFDLNFSSTNSKKKLSNPPLTAKVIRDLAAAGGDNSKLDFADISAATGAEKATAQHIAQKGDKNFIDLPAVQAALGGGSPSTGEATTAEISTHVANPNRKGDWKDAIISLVSSDIDLAKRLLVSLGKKHYGGAGPISGTSAYAKAYEEINKTSPSTQAVTTSIKGLFDMIDALEDSIKAKDLPITSPFGGLDAIGLSKNADVDIGTTPAVAQRMDNLVTKATAQIGNLKMDQSVANQLALFDGATIEERLAQIGDVVRIIKSETLPSGFSDKDALEFAAKANVAIYLANAAKMAHGVAAGYDFEQFVINFFGGIGAGPINGAIDAILKDENGGLMPTSQKFLAGGSTTQSKAGKGYGLNYVFDKYDKIVYMIGQKVRDKKSGSGRTGASGGTYSVLEIYITVFEKLSNGKFKGTVLDRNGGVLKTTPTKDDFDFSYDDLGGTPTVDIEILDNPDDSVVAIAEMVSTSLSKTSKAGLFAKIETVFRRFENMKRNTQSYLATSKKAGINANDAKTYVDQISRDYVDSKGDLNFIFKPVTGTASTITEGAKKITSNFLKKLISENFKK